MTTYSASSNGTTPTDRKFYECGTFCVSGPGNGFGYYSWASYPSRQFESFEQTEVVAKMRNDAFQAGKREIQREIQKTLGIK